MNCQTQRILGQEATLFRDGSTPIYLLPDGRFAVQYGGKWVAKASLKSAEKISNSTRPSLKIFHADIGQVSHSPDLRIVEASDYQERKILDKDGKRVYTGWGSWFLFDADKVERLRDLEKRRSAFEKEINKEYVQITKGTVAVDRHNFKDLLKKQET